MSRHADLSPIGQRIAAVVEAAALDLRFLRMSDAAEYAAVRVLADSEIAAGLRASAALAAIDTMHQPRTWGGTSRVTVCDRCNSAWPCETRWLIADAQTPARDGLVPAAPSGTQTPAAGQVGEALPAAGHHPDWDGNRCRNCNARLSDGGPCPADDLAALRAMQGPVVSANDGACVCGAEIVPGHSFANPDPQCGVGTHRLAAQKLGRTA